MSTDNNAFFDLYKANAAYFQRALQLAQQGSRQWLDLGRHACTQASGESSGVFKALTQAKTPQDFAALPVALFDAQSRCGASAMQDTAAAAADIQAGLIAEAADAIKQWQHASLAAVEAMAAAGAANPWARSFAQAAAPARKAAGRGEGTARAG